MEKYGFVYLWFDRKHKRYYLGSHWGTEDDDYICSSNSMREAYRRRKEDFKRCTIKRIFTNRKATFIAEQYYLNMIKNEEYENVYYNISCFAKKHWSGNDRLRKIVGEKISILHKGRIFSEEHKKKLSLSLQGKKSSEQTKEKIRKFRLGKSVSQETKIKISEGKKGKVPKNIELLKKINKGKILSEDTKKKISIARKLYYEQKNKNIKG